MKRGGRLRVDPAKTRDWQYRAAKKYAEKVAPKPFSQRGSSNNPGPMKIPFRAPKPSPRRRNDASWREAVFALRGAYCRGCLTVAWLQCDHVCPRSQGGKSDVENGLVLCESCHRAKTESRIVIEFDWLDTDQIPYLADVGWVWWDEIGEPRGRGFRHFGRRWQPTE